MKIWNVLAIIAMIEFFALIFVWSAKKRSKRRKKDPFNLDYLPYKEKLILTKNEYAFYTELRKVTDKNGLLICPKVGLKELFDVTDSEQYLLYFNKINKKHVDFLICDNKLRPVYAIELDDKTHQREDRMKSDQLKDALFKLSRITLIRYKASMNYSKDEIRTYLDRALWS